MAFCESCGIQVTDDTKYCPSCGKAASSEQSQSIQQPQDTGAQDIQKNKVMAALAYILFFIPMLTGTCKISPFVKFHTNQGTVLFIAALIWHVIVNILAVILIPLAILKPGPFVTFLSLILTEWGWVVWSFLVIFATFISWPVIFAVYGIVNAVRGKFKPLPLIGRIKIIK